VSDDKLLESSLRALHAEGPSDVGRETIERALAAHSDGLKYLAAQVLGRWADPVSKRRLWDVFLESEKLDPFGWEYKDIAVKALRTCVTDEDAPWLLDYYFSVPDYRAKLEVLSLVLRLDIETLRRRCIAESADQDRGNRLAAMKVVTHLHLKEERQVLERLALDQDSEVAAAATAALGEIAAFNRRTVDDPVLRAVVAEFLPVLKCSPILEATPEDGTPPRLFYIAEIIDRDESSFRVERQGRGFLDELVRQSSIPNGQLEDAKGRATTPEFDISLGRGRICQCWVLTSEGVTPLEPERWRETTPRATHGMFYDRGTIAFYVAADGNRVHLDWAVGPLYGRGWTYDLCEGIDGVTLRNPALRWMS
jgi:hypothetical protein